MTRTEVNVTTGEVVTIEQHLYQNAEGHQIAVDVGIQPPEGYTLVEVTE